MNSIKGVGSSLSWVLVGIIGGIAFSQGASFAMWDKSHPDNYFINFHAGLISALGLGLFLLQGIFSKLLKRIDELEKIVNQLKSNDK